MLIWGKGKKEKMKKNNQNISVFLRVRPVIDIEKTPKLIMVVDCPTSKEVVVRERSNDKSRKTFNFDEVFGPMSRQVDVYKSVVTPLIAEVLAGYDCTVFAYGQTGTGKTFTMVGEPSSDLKVSWIEDPSIGVVPRALSHLFDELKLLNVEYIVKVSFLELYNEELYDLLSPDEDISKISLYENALKKVVVHGLEEVTVNDKNSVYDILLKGSLKRRTAATLMNAQSSRSHTVFSITIHIKENSVDGEEFMKTGKLNLVDLAGSENISQSGAQDKHAREAGKINQSLLALGRVIAALTEKRLHVPYRDSKLTHLLKDSLGGHTKTSIIATISPVAINVGETLSTLEYACRAKNITNQPEVNKKLTKTSFLKVYADEIERLKAALHAMRERNGVFIHPEDFIKMEANSESVNHELVENMERIGFLQAELEKRMALYDEVSAKLRLTEFTLALTKEQLLKASQVRDEKAHLVLKHAETEETLRLQADSLIAVADQVTSDFGALDDKLSRKRLEEIKTADATRQFHEDCTEGLCRMEARYKEFMSNVLNILRGLHANLGEVCGKQLRDQATERDSRSTALQMVTRMTNSLEQLLKSQIDQLGQLLEEQLVLARTSADKEERFLEHILEKVLPQSVQVFINCHQLLKDVLQKGRNSTIQQVEKIEEMVMTTGAELRQAMVEMRDKHELLAMRHEAKISKSRELDRAHCQEEASLDKKLFPSYDQLVESILSLRSQQEVRAAQSEQRLAELTSSIDQMSGTVKDSLLIAQDFQQQANPVITTLTSVSDLKNVLVQDMASYRAEMEPVQDEEEAGLEKLEEGVKVVVLDLIEIRNEGCISTDKAIRRHLDLLRKGLVDGQECAEGLITSFENSAKVEQEFLVRNQQEMQATLEEQHLQLDLEVGHIDKWREMMKDEIMQRVAEVDSFKECQLTRDMPTGLTPKRREFHYPRTLTAMSPDQRILERFRLAKSASNNSQLSHLECLEVKPCEPTMMRSPRMSKSTSDIPSASKLTQDKENTILGSDKPDGNGVGKYQTQRVKSSTVLTMKNT